MKKTRKFSRILRAGAFLLLVLVLAGGLYLADYYRADRTAITAFSPEFSVSHKVLSDNTHIYGPEDAKAGLIFYPGGKVEHGAYEPLMRACAAQGVLCILVEMPFRLAVLDVGAADGIRQQYPGVETWYMAGHSLGGAMAASYVSAHPQEFAGLVLLAAYSTQDLSDTGLQVLSVYGSEDGVLNREKYEENRGNLPDDYTELVLEGGCHAQFGMYGAQKGDGVPTLSAPEQIRLTAQAIGQFLS